MSFLLRFRFKKKTVVETLEGIDKQIKKYESSKDKAQKNERRYVDALVIYSTALYILGALVYYLYLMPKSLIDRTKTLIPFFISPILIYLIRRFVKWFYVRRSFYFDKKLVELRVEKKKLIEEVKEKETFKVACEILKRFSDTELIPDKNPKLPVNIAKQPIQQYHSLPGSKSQQQLNAQTPMVNRAMPAPPNTVTMGPNGRNNAMPMMPYNQHQQQLFKLVRPILSQTRSTFDKLIDLVIGDGPNNRYALICQSCASHNGMAMKEEFEYIAFKCVYCGFPNKERKTRPKMQGFGDTFMAANANDTILTERNAESKTMSSRDEAISSEIEQDELAINLPIAETISTVESNDVSMNEEDSSDLSKSFDEKKNE